VVLVTLTESDPSEFVFRSMTMLGFDDDDVGPDCAMGMAMAIGIAIGSLCSLFGTSVDAGGALGDGQEKPLRPPVSRSALSVVIVIVVLYSPSIDE
jgi:hypothetical protein